MAGVGVARQVLSAWRTNERVLHFKAQERLRYGVRYNKQST